MYVSTLVKWELRTGHVCVRTTKILQWPPFQHFKDVLPFPSATTQIGSEPRSSWTTRQSGILSSSSVTPARNFPVSQAALFRLLSRNCLLLPLSRVKHSRTEGRKLPLPLNSGYCWFLICQLYFMELISWFKILYCI